MKIYTPLKDPYNNVHNNFAHKSKKHRKYLICSSTGKWTSNF